MWLLNYNRKKRWIFRLLLFSYTPSCSLVWVQTQITRIDFQENYAQISPFALTSMGYFFLITFFVFFVFVFFCFFCFFVDEKNIVGSWRENQVIVLYPTLTQEVSSQHDSLTGKQWDLQMIGDETPTSSDGGGNGNGNGVSNLTQISELWSWI